METLIDDRFHRSIGTFVYGRRQEQEPKMTVKPFKVWQIPARWTLGLVPAKKFLEELGFEELVQGRYKAPADWHTTGTDYYDENNILRFTILPPTRTSQAYYIKPAASAYA